MTRVDTNVLARVDTNELTHADINTLMTRVDTRGTSVLISTHQLVLIPKPCVSSQLLLSTGKPGILQDPGDFSGMSDRALFDRIERKVHSVQKATDVCGIGHTL